MNNINDFQYTKTENCHIKRRREILKSHPEVKELVGNYPLSALYIVLIITFHLISAYIFREYSWTVVTIGAYVFGAFFSHSLYVMIHECTHNLVFKTTLSNRIMGIICDIPLFVPSAMGFRKYHMIHHKHLGEYSYDPDIVSHTEGSLVGNSTLKKSIWLFFFFLSQGLRPIKVKYYNPLDGWSVFNTVFMVIVNILIYVYLGPKALAYLALSTLFGLGLHPLGGRWIQEHFITKEGQETYSYYGVLNYLTFNMGYHNEHHDLMNIPWANLKKLNSIANEFYSPLKSYNSWTKVILNFITNAKMTPFTRIVHPDRHPAKLNLNGDPKSAQTQS